MPDRKKPTKDEMTFEQAVDRLEEVVKAMESGTLSLEKMMAHFEEGGKLVTFCTKQLDEVERKIEVLVKQGDAIVAEPFDAEPEENNEA